ncbi:MAG TPA: DUF427 domain-containing protein [Gaiellaceae bacterium]
MGLAARIAERIGGEASSGRAPGTRMRAVWNGAVLAESDRTVKLEGNHYFPPDSLNREYFADSDRKTVCPWKGLASYYTVEVGGERNEGAAWTYRNPSPLARKIKDHVAFWQGVQISPAD